MLKCLNAQVIKQDNVSETIIINNDKKSQSRLLFQFIWRSGHPCCLLETTEKDIRNKKSKQTSTPIKEDNGNLTTDDTEKATMLNDYFRTVDEKLIGPADEIHAHSRQNVDIPTTTSIDHD